MMAAAIELVAENGYEKTNVRQIVSRARVSFSAFSQAFDDKAGCFLSACERSADELLTEMYRAAGATSWIEAVRTGTVAYLQWWEEHPSFARAYFLGMPLAGSEISERGRNYDGYRTMFAALGMRARQEQPELPPLREIVPSAIVHAVANVVRDQVRDNQPLLPLCDSVIYLVVKLLADEATAHAAIKG